MQLKQQVRALRLDRLVFVAVGLLKRNEERRKTISIEVTPL